MSERPILTQSSLTLFAAADAAPALPLSLLVVRSDDVTPAPAVLAGALEHS